MLLLPSEIGHCGEKQVATEWTWPDLSLLSRERIGDSSHCQWKMRQKSSFSGWGSSSQSPQQERIHRLGRSCSPRCGLQRDSHMTHQDREHGIDLLLKMSSVCSNAEGRTLQKGRGVYTWWTNHGRKRHAPSTAVRQGHFKPGGKMVKNKVEKGTEGKFWLHSTETWQREPGHLRPSQVPIQKAGQLWD